MRTYPFPWYLAVPLTVPLLWMASLAITELRAQQLTALAEAQQQEFQFDQAQATRRAAAALSPQDAELQLALAKGARALWTFRGTPELKREADSAFKRASQLSPHWAEPAYEHARMYSFKEQYAHALKLLEPAFKHDPNHAGYWLERARYLEALQRPADARTAYARCEKLNPVRACVDGVKRLATP